MKKTLVSMIALMATTTATLAAECGRREVEYQLDWTSSAAVDASPIGRPLMAYAMPTQGHNNTRDLVEVNFNYGGTLQRFSFDSPRVVELEEVAGGGMLINQNLLASYEMTETKLTFDRPVKNLTLDVHGIDDNAKFGRSYFDQVSLIARTGSGDLHNPDGLRFLGIPDYEHHALMRSEKSRGLSGGRLYPVDLRGSGGDGYASFRVSFGDEVAGLSIRLTNAVDKGALYSTSANPSPQEILLGKMTFCVSK